MRWILFEDPRAERLRPFTWLRPPSSLLLGALTTRKRWWRLAAPDDEVAVACGASRARLVPGRLALARALAETRDGDLWVSDLWIPDEDAPAMLRGLPEDALARLSGGDDPDPPDAFRVGPEIRRMLESAAGLPEALAGLARSGLASVEVGGRRLASLADLLRWQEPLLAADLESLLRERPAPASLADASVYEADAIRLGAGCRVDHGAVLDARDGPVVLGEGCHVFPHTWIRGPLSAGRECLFLGGRIGGGCSFGPGCRVRGEVESSVFLGWSNKAHDGYVGHSYVGEWVNLGALTTTSDLKNNYSEISLERPGGKEPTGLRKLGAFVGDHAKTRIGCLLGCGTIVGVGANVIDGPAVTVKWVPDFNWGWGSSATAYDVGRFLETAEIVFGRRGVPWTAGMEELLREVHRAARMG
jgi:UDP-N-acetylglucosamine diphosphorylase/glucosamine-1-phosphate N-acetyltransferase